MRRILHGSILVAATIGLFAVASTAFAYMTEGSLYERTQSALRGIDALSLPAPASLVMIAIGAACIAHGRRSP